MSPRLLFLLTTLRTRHAFDRDRDRSDARLAATRMGIRRPLRLLATPDPINRLPIAA